MNFNEISYNRIDFFEFEKKYRSILDRINDASRFEDIKTSISDLNIVRNHVETMKTVAEIRYSINTNDKFYIDENKFWNEYEPLILDLDIMFYNCILNSRFKEEIIEEYGNQFYNLIKCKIDTFSKEVIGLLQEENKLMSEYTELLASAKIDFDGKVCNLSDLSAYSMNLDEKIRKESIVKHTEFFKKNEEKFDELFDKLVKLRDNIAKKLGYDNFIELGYKRMSRTDYNSEMVSKLRTKILERFVPAANKLYKEQASRIGVDKIDYYNEKIEFSDGNATLIGDQKYIIEKGKEMYSQLSDETKEFFEYLISNELFDVSPREGKAMGGYCTILPEYKEPFIFGNFNGTVDDIDVLTHEAGHAFQVYMSRDIEMPELIFPTLDSCEIHSMSMEFFTYPWMDLFFGDMSEKYKKYHHDSAVKFLPYGTLVDHFQHIIYEHPNLSPNERKEIWRDLERKYLPHRDYKDLDLLECGGYWYRQGHIFKDPFYYIDYVLAQLCALEFYEDMKHDYKGAWKRYMEICKVGGEYSFLEIVKLAKLENPFE
ncbi:M3 family oligoendopeptidase [Peptostreptococcus faecalis]|uniref:M3 family oligoendopeptidase n=1 Tax=Peptostreptococcus faecalis TaxID=2045015 RepID=UPI000C7B8B37|nr:M3 family oligoendopeptidase [Peptostreptococcus faecalis]